MSYRILPILLFVITKSICAQQKGYSKFELGHYRYHITTAIYDIADSNWEGPDLFNNQHANYVSLGKGTHLFQKKLNLGIILSYLNFKGTHGMNLLGEMQLNPFDDNGSPFLNLRLGYHHLWNQYLNGKGSLMADFGAGVKFIVTPDINIYVKSGIVFSHNTLFLPFALGCQF